MTTTEMVTAANAYTDESFKATLCLSFVNEAIGTINAELDCTLPFISNVDTDYVALSETWIRQVLIPYICYSIKMNDGSISEASIFQRSYEQGMKRLSDNKFSAIPTTYQSSNFSKVFQIDYVGGLSGNFDIPIRPFTIAEYDEYTNYYEGDYVSYNSVEYVCIKDSVGNLPTDTTYWREYE